LEGLVLLLQNAFLVANLVLLG
jgi:hypothetical protein